jgi:dipeptidyl aminopeptidase/acylaminoacyl peptidase
MQISPDGQNVAFIAGVGNEASHHVVVFLSLTTGETSIVEAGPSSADPDYASEVVEFRWLNSNRIVLIYARPDGERQGLAAVDRDGKGWWDSPGLSNIFFVPGNSNSFLARSATPNTPVVYEIDSTTRRSEPSNYGGLSSATHTGGGFKLVAKDNLGANGWIPDREGKVRVGISYDGEDTNAFYRDDEDAPWVRLHDFDFHGLGALPIAVDWDGHTAYAATLTQYGTWGISSYDLAAQRKGPMIAADPAYDMVSPTDILSTQSALRFSRKRGKLVGVTYPTQLYKTIWFDPEMARIQEYLDKALPDTMDLICGWSDDENKFLIESWSDRHPAVYYLLDIGTKRLRKIMDSTPWIETSKMAKTYPLSYRSRDSLLVHGYLTLPAGSSGKNLPLVVLADSEFNYGRTTLGYYSFVQFLANCGYAVMRVNPRGSTGYGKAFFEAGKRQAGAGIQNDITDGVLWAIRKGIADPRRVAFVGRGFGGYCADWALANTPDCYRCGVSISGISDWFAFMKRLEDHDEVVPFLRAEVGNFWTEPQRLHDISVIDRVGRIRAPMLLINGEIDAEYLRDDSKKFAAVLRDHGKACEVKIVPKAKDGVEAQRQSAEYLTQIGAFLDANMQ